MSFRPLCVHSARATSSLPVPVSPRISTGWSEPANCPISRYTFCIASLCPTRAGPVPGRWTASGRGTAAGGSVSWSTLRMIGPSFWASSWYVPGLTR